jgi:hypothetical protein
MKSLGMLSEQSAIMNHRYPGNANQPLGLADSAAFGDVGSQCQNLLFAQMGAEQRSAFTLGKPGLAGSAVQQPQSLALSVPATNRYVSQPPFSVIGALLVLTT